MLIGKEVAKRDALYQTVGMTGEHMRHVLDKTGARMLFNNTLQGFDDDAGKKRLAYTAQLAEGRDVSSTAQVHGSGALVGLQGLIPHRLGEAWQKLSELEVPDKLAAIRKAPFREQLITEARAFEGEWTNISWMYYLGNGASPDHSMGDHNRLTDMAKAAGEYWAETFLRLSDETDGRALFNLVGENQNLKALRDLLREESFRVSAMPRSCWDGDGCRMVDLRVVSLGSRRWAVHHGRSCSTSDKCIRPHPGA